MPVNGRILGGGVLQMITRLPLWASSFRLLYFTSFIFIFYFYFSAEISSVSKCFKFPYKFSSSIMELK